MALRLGTSAFTWLACHRVDHRARESDIVSPFASQGAPMDRDRGAADGCLWHLRCLAIETNLAVAAAVVLACYVPFVFYWNLRA